jgi:hypothetical protein
MRRIQESVDLPEKVFVLEGRTFVLLDPVKDAITEAAEFVEEVDSRHDISSLVSLALVDEGV